MNRILCRRVLLLCGALMMLMLVIAACVFQLNHGETVPFLDETETGYGQTGRYANDIPSMYIDTSSGSMKYIHAKKGNEESGNLRIYDADDTLAYEGKLDSLNGRGNSTWEFYEKKPYSLQLTGEADLLGMGKAQKWILLANAGDASHMRNKIVYDFSQEFQLEYSPESRWVNLYLNGEYQGLYLLCERNEVHTARVDVPVETGFLVSSDMQERVVSQGNPCITTELNQALRVHYVPASENALNDLQVKWQSIENAIMTEDGIDPLTGKSWQELIDLDSWVRKYLIEEVFGNFDAAFLSQYYYSDGKENSKVFAGPVWDFDYSMGCISAWQIETPNALFADRLHVKPGYDTPWYDALCRKTEFRTRMLELYRYEFLPLLSDFLDNRIDEYVQQIQNAVQADYVRWSVQSDVHSEAEYIKQYLTARVSFLNSIWLEEEEYCVVSADSTMGNNYGYYYVKPGNTVSDLKMLADNEYQSFLGWYYADTDELFDPERPIYEDVQIYAKWQDTSGKKMGQLIKLIPLGIVAILLTIFVIADISRNTQRR